MTPSSRLHRWLPARVVLQGVVALVALALVVATVPRLTIHAHASIGADDHAHAHASSHGAHAGDAHHDGGDQPSSGSDPVDATHVHQLVTVPLALPDITQARVVQSTHEPWPGFRDRAAPPETSANPPYRPPIA